MHRCKTLCKALLVLGGLALAGCASTPREPFSVRYDARRNVTTYQTKRMRADNVSWDTGMGRQRALDLQAEALCMGQDCRPPQVAVVFLTSGTDPLYIPDRSIAIIADGERFDWADLEKRDLRTSAPVRGKIVEVRMSLDRLSRIARAEDVRGLIGSSRFTLSYEARAPLRALLERLAS